MKKTLSILFVLLSALLILDTLNAGHALTMFLLVGIIPGTNISIDASRMLEYILILTGFTLSRLTTGSVRAYSQRPRVDSRYASKGTILSAQS